ncbi:dienelactone hydrolase [Arenicella chitinivorans]|uniref:Dienelactone hydrolase n=1 Tax=Arenicella chitinivorans TaxID=1329800 RepID=A0A918RNH2_9GAMM|nr:prolyl oligopeptidase family serine peptidase [Arenicella chitinivorans]GHA04350.1 dienelactone hydrolase [Arenicella chitinivorans]
MSWLKRIFLFISSAVLAAGLYFASVLNGWLVPAATPSAISALITPHLTVYRPDGDGPFKTILMFHGCGKDPEQQQYWGETFQNMGYAAVYVDSYAGRGISPERAQAKVCRGRELLGAQRAGDVLAAITWANQQTWTAKQDIVLMGWSHGAWSIMDAYAFDQKGELPHGVSAEFTADLASIRQVVLFYPYCGVASQTDKSGWQHKPIVLAIDVANDSVVDSSLCGQSYDWISKSGVGVQHHVLEGVGHAFDVDAVSQRENRTYRTPKAQALAAVDKVKRLLQSFFDRT